MAIGMQVAEKVCHVHKEDVNDVNFSEINSVSRIKKTKIPFNILMQHVFTNLI